MSRVNSVYRGISVKEEVVNMSFTKGQVREGQTGKHKTPVLSVSTIFSLHTTNKIKAFFLTWWCQKQKGSREKVDENTCRWYYSPWWKSFFYLKCLSGLSKVLMRLTIQLKRRPYSALAMASLTSVAFSTVLGRIIVSPRVTTQWEVRASCSSSAWIHSKDAPGKQGHRQGSEADFGRRNRHFCNQGCKCNVLWIRAGTMTNKGVHIKQLSVSNLVTSIPSFHCSQWASD